MSIADKGVECGCEELFEAPGFQVSSESLRTVY